MRTVSRYIRPQEIRNPVLKSVVSLALAGLAAAQLSAVAAASPTNISTNTIGSGKQYRTTVERQTQGELSAEDLHQASVLSSQMLLHLNEAAQRLTDGRAANAKAEINKAETLNRLVRELLPVTTVTTTVRDAQGKEVYRDVQRVQDDLIPIFSGAVAVEVVEPIIEAKKDEAALKGLRLADADLIHTAVLLARLHDDVDRLFDSFFEGWGMPSLARMGRFGERGLLSPGFLRPSVDISENKKGYTIRVEIPGVEKDDVKLTIEDDTLLISGEKRQEKEDNNGGYHCVERSYGAFQRVVSLHHHPPMWPE